MKSLIYTLLAALLIACAPASTFAQNAKNINVSISEKNGLKKITIKKTLEDGTIDVTNWEGTGEIPEEIKKEMEEGGAFLIQTEKGNFKFFSNDSLHVEEGPHQIMLINDTDVNGELKKEIEVIVEQSKNGNTNNGAQNIKVIHLDKDWEGKEGDKDLEKELKIIVEQVKSGKSMEGAQNIKVIRIDEEGEVELDENDVEVQIHQIKNGSDENVVELIVEEEGTEKKAHKMLIIKRVEVKEILEEGTPETTTTVTKPQVVEIAPQVLERSLQLQDFQISPNPASEMVNLSFKGESSPTTIRVLGLDGKQIYKEFIRDFNGLYQNNIDLKGIDASFVIINIEQDGKIYSEKLAVKR